jgi:site-specific DNA recombinase
MTMTLRAAIYARFSSDLQRDRSIDDQIALCRSYGERQGYLIVATFSDRALSGASIHRREGIKELLGAARSGAFDIVIAESMSRIGRDQEDRAGIRKRLQFANVRLATPVDGIVSSLTDGIRAVIDSQQLEDLKHQIRRGMEGVVRDGRHAGGRAYGYRAVPGKPGELEIVPAEAAIVRRIFECYLAGEMPRQIAHALNAENIPPPRGAWWGSSAIQGSTKRKNGILQNDLYVGRIVWNKSHKRLDPDTGRRVNRPNPEGEWRSASAPHLRILEDALFLAVQAQRRSRSYLSPRQRIAPRRILSGLLRCGACGSGMSLKDIDHGRPRIVCTQAKEAGTCGNRRTYYLDAIERATVAGLKDRLCDHTALKWYIRCYNDERQRIASHAISSRERLEAALTAAEKAIERAVDLVLRGVLTEQEASLRLPELRHEADTLRLELAGIEAPSGLTVLHQANVDRYVRDLDRLEELLRENAASGDAEPLKAFRALVNKVTVQPAVGKDPVPIEVEGRLAALATTEQLRGDAWCRVRDLNSRPTVYKTAALPLS